MSNITDKGMQGLPTAVDQWLTESFGRGNGALLGRISPNGNRSFYYRYAGSQGQVRLPVGPFHPKGDGHTGFTVAQARARSMDWAALRRDKGIADLREFFAEQNAAERQRFEGERQEHEAALKLAESERQRRMTMDQLFDRWCQTDLQPRINASGQREGRKDGGKLARQQYMRHVSPKLGAIPLEQVTRANLIDLMDEQRNAGRHRTAQMMWADLRQMLTFALDRQLLTHDPLGGVEKARIVGKAAERARFLAPEELTILAGALPKARLATRSQHAIWLTLATGVRVGELVGAIWADLLPTDPVARQARLHDLAAVANQDEAKLGVVNMAERTWYLTDTKNQRDHTIHISDFALAHLNSLTQLREVITGTEPAEISPWVFPGEDNKLPLKRATIGKQLAQRLKQRSKAHDALVLPGGHWSMHDLRRTTGTLMAELGVSGDNIDECLNHKIESNVRRRYVRTRRLEEQRQAFNILSLFLEQRTRGYETKTTCVP